MTPKHEIQAALDQLISLVAGREAAIRTNDLAGDPVGRIREVTNVISEELIGSTQSGDIKAIKQCQRKVTSLTSLKTLATCLMDEVDWE
jgi:hypothetical protein